MPVDPGEYAAALRPYAAGVVLLTVRDDIDDVGTTVTSLMSVSADPPLVALGLAADGYPAEVLQSVGAGVVNVLSAEQAILASRFSSAGRPSARHLLESVPWQRAPVSDAIALEGARPPWTAGCSVVAAGSHVLVLLSVEAVPVLAAGGDPLIRLRGRWTRRHRRRRRPRREPPSRAIASALPCHIAGRGGAVRVWTSSGTVRSHPSPPCDLSARRDGAVASRSGAVRADLEAVFRADYPRVVAVAARVLGSRDQAEDVAQEVFLSFSRSTGAGRRGPGWLCVAAAHTALNLLRSGRRRAAREEAAADGPAVVPDVAEAVVTREERRPVRAALARLPRKQAVALVLRHSGLSYADVAAALDMSPGSVGTTVRRAESALRKELSRHASSD